MPIKPLSRRTVLRGAGVSLMLPFLEAMLPINRSWAAAPSRFASLYKGDGAMYGLGEASASATNLDYWFCNSMNQLSAPVKELEAFKDYLTIVQGCAFKNFANQADHSRSGCSFLTGADIAGLQPATTNETNLQTITGASGSLDRMIAQRRQTPVDSLMMGVGPLSADNPTASADWFMGNNSWNSPTQHLTNQVNRTVRDAFAKLTGSGLIKSAAGMPVAANPQKAKVVDRVKADLTALMAKLGPTDKARVDEYVTSLTTIETEAKQTLNTGATCLAPTGVTPAFQDDNVGGVDYGNFDRTAQRMIDLMVLAFQCGITDVSTLLLSYDHAFIPPERIFGLYGVAPVPGTNLHEAGHHFEDPAKITCRRLVDQWHAKKLAYFAQRMKATPDSNGGNLLDNTLTLFGAGMGDPFDHNHKRTHRILLGRGAGLNPGLTGKIVNVANGDKSHAWLLQTIAIQFGITQTIGDSGGRTLAGIF